MHTLQQIEETGDVEPLVAMFTEDANSVISLPTGEPLQGTMAPHRFWRKYLSSIWARPFKFTNVRVMVPAVLGGSLKIAFFLSTGESVSYQRCRAMLETGQWAGAFARACTTIQLSSCHKAEKVT